MHFWAKYDHSTVATDDLFMKSKITADCF